jgi:2-phospho-L-lactate guanylyltransferase
MSSRVARSSLMTSLDLDRRAWTIIIPVKPFARAKSRLVDFTPDHRRELALAFALDTVVAALETPSVHRVVVVTNDSAAQPCADLGAELLDDQPDAGLNPALVYAAQALRTRDPNTSVAALSADLPALTALELTTVFDLMRSAYWFVGDAAGTGTTLLAAREGHRLTPAFGPGSYAAHRALGAEEATLDGLVRLRQDVDTPADLEEAVRLGVGRHTRAALSLG